MTNILKQMYQDAGKGNAYYDDKLPVDLFRAQSRPDFKKEVFMMTPHPGYEKRDAAGNIIKKRPPDVSIIERDGTLIVLGCRCMEGEFRGISLFDKKVSWLGSGWLNYLVPAGTPIPDSLMVTRDKFNRGYGATHYTLGPKDDMPLELFIATLKVVAMHAQLIQDN